MTDIDSNSDLFATTEYSAPGPPQARDDYQPWHLPRKQFVRRQQWLHQMARLLQHRPIDRPLRYLGLPGADLLDLRLFHKELCSVRALRFLGFNTGARTGESSIALNISLDEIRAFDNVDPKSDVLTDDFRSLARQNTIGWKSAFDAGPFDVVNLDLCNNLLTDGLSDNSIYHAIARLFALQAKSKEPWLLFLTTRSDKASVHADVVEQLNAVLDQNVHSCAEFEETYRSMLGTDRGHGALPNLSTCTPDEWPDVFCVALTKWILKLALANRMILDFKSCMSYKVEPTSSQDDLISVAFHFTPSSAPPQDGSGLTPSIQSDVSECVLAARIPGRALKRIAVDAAVADDDDLLTDLLEETTALLKDARYDTDRYLTWALD